VAFTARATQHDIPHLGSGQVIVFDIIETNIGNAYNKHTGTFTAPFGGIYVIHVTVGGWRAFAPDSHNYIDVFVNSRALASLLLTIGEQSSQMIVVALNASDVVTIRNSHQDDSILGSLWSTFSGFLLYETDVSELLVG